MDTQLLTTYNRHPDQDICNCTKCPQFGNSRFADRRYSHSHFCDIQDGSIKDPEWSWCKVGIALMWMTSHSAGDVVEFMGGVSEIEKRGKHKSNEAAKSPGAAFLAGG